MSVETDRLQHEYQKCFDTAEGKAVLRDLARFCNVGISVAPTMDPTLAYSVESMRRVFWYIYHQVHSEKQPAKTARTAAAMNFDSFDPLLQTRTSA